MMLHLICYYLYNLKNVQSTHGGVLLLTKLHSSMEAFQIFQTVQMIKIAQSVSNVLIATKYSRPKQESGTYSEPCPRKIQNFISTSAFCLELGIWN